MVPSVSIKAWERKPRGCFFQTRCRVLLMASIKSTMASWSKRRVKSPLVVGSGMRCAQAIQKSLIVAPQFDIFQPLAIQKRIVGQVQHMITLVIGQMALEQLHPPIDLLG